MPHPPARNTILTWSLAVIVAVLAGCRGEAEQRVRLSALRHAAMLETHASVIDEAEVDDYMDDMAAMILDGARQLDGKRVEADRDEKTDAYDRFDVVVVHSMALNAWVYGDDFTCVTTNLLMQAEHPEEIAAVLCHEFAHIREDHIVEANEREISNRTWSSTISILGQAGDITAMMLGVPMPVPVSSLTEAAADATRASFDPRCPDDEFEADAYAVELYAALGLDRQRFDDFLERMIELYGIEDSPSHPSASERLERARRLLARLDEDEWGTARELDADRFAAVQTKLRKMLIERLRGSRLVTFEQSGAMGQSSLIMTSCAPPPVDADRLRTAFYRAMRRPSHRPATQPEPDQGETPMVD